MEVLIVLRSLNEAFGPDQIPERILKEIAHAVAPSVTRMVNKFSRTVSNE